VTDRLTQIEKRWVAYEKGTTRAAADYRWMVAEIKRLREELSDAQESVAVLTVLAHAHTAEAPARGSAAELS
jgi:hypothetical protein